MKTKKILLWSALLSAALLAVLIIACLALSKAGQPVGADPENPVPEGNLLSGAGGDGLLDKDSPSGTGGPSDSDRPAESGNDGEAAPSEETDPEPVFDEYDIHLMAVGDNLMHMGIVNTGRMEDGSYDYSFLFRDIEAYLQAADIKVINQETILGGNDLGFSGYPRFNSPEEVGDAIADAGFNVVLHATNHAADQRLEGILNCVSFWETNHPDILMTGISGDEPSDDIPLLQIKDVTFAILNYTYGPNAETLSRSLHGHLNMLCAYDESSGRIDFTSLNPRVTEDIQKARELADIVVVFPHWGTEYQTKPSSWQRAFAEQMTEAGADLIIGTHPHVPQPVEWITSENGNASLCYYSLGNYVSTQKKAICMLEEMAWVTFHVTEEGVTLSPDDTGLLPLVCQYKSGPMRLKNIYLLEDYTEELAAVHGIRGYGGVSLKLEDLQRWSQEIFGDWILKGSDILKDSDPPH
ncbi:MAG: CapA family protein [Roseburia sp.]|nr:CapA family protein [Roseburia sp.]MCM1097392.1 CapA family protein [Ruminococcus flavefaciens]